MRKTAETDYGVHKHACAWVKKRDKNGLGMERRIEIGGEGDKDGDAWATVSVVEGNTGK